MNTLLKPEQNHTETKEIILSKTSKSWNGATLPKYPVGNPEISILKYIIPRKTKLDLHKHPIISAGIIIKGELTIINENNDRLHLKSGESFVELVDTWHYGHNESNHPVEIIVFYAGIKGQSITTKKDA